MRTVASQMLATFGFSVRTAQGGAEALALLREHHAAVRVVLLDLSMPGMDGVETFIEIHQRYPDIPVILCSGYNEQEAIPNFSGKGLAGFIQKPFDLQELKKNLESLVPPGGFSPRAE